MKKKYSAEEILRILGEEQQGNKRYVASAGKRNITHKRVERVRQGNNLQAYAKGKANRRVKMPASDSQRKQASSLDEIWSYDFKQYRTRKGRTARIFVICDEYSHECLSLTLHVATGSVKSGKLWQDSWKPQNASLATSEAITAPNSSRENFVMASGAENRPIYTMSS